MWGTKVEYSILVLADMLSAQQWASYKFRNVSAIIDSSWSLR